MPVKAASVPTNVAEGFERAPRKDYLLFLNVAKGSAGEARSLLRVALEIGYLDESSYNRLRDEALALSRYLSNQIKAIKNTVPEE